MCRERVASFLIGSCLVLAAACQSTPVASTGGADDQAAVSPIANYKQQEMMKAMRGLEFVDGLVVVDQKFARTVPGRGNRQAAARQFADAQALLEANDWVRAIEAHKLAVVMLPDEPTYLNGLGNAFVTKGKAAEAQASFRTALELDPEYLEAQLNLARSLRGSGQIEEGLAGYERALEIDPDAGEAHAVLAVEGYYAGDYRTAWSHLHAAERVGAPVPPQLRTLLAASMPEPGR